MLKGRGHDARGHDIDEHAEDQRTAVPEEDAGGRDVEQDEPGEGPSEGKAQDGEVGLAGELEPQGTGDGHQKTVAAGKGVDAVNEVDRVDHHDVDEQGKGNGHPGAQGAHAEEAGEVVDHEATTEDEDGAHRDLNGQLFQWVQLGQVVFEAEEEQDGGGGSQSEEGHSGVTLRADENGGGDQGANEDQYSTQPGHTSRVDLSVLRRVVQKVLLNRQANQRRHPQHHDSK